MYYVGIDLHKRDLMAAVEDAVASFLTRSQGRDSVHGTDRPGSYCERGNERRYVYGDTITVGACWKA